MSPMTLRSLERGGSGVTMGAYLAVMQVLGIEKDLDLLGAADPLGRELQDARLTVHSKASAKRPTSATDATAQRPALIEPAKPPPREGARRWIEKSGFTSAQALADLIDPKGISPKKGR